MGARDSSAVLKKALGSILRPVVHFSLRNSISFHDFLDITKRVFVDVSRELLEAEEQKVNVSRISVLSGLYRQDVTRIYKEGTSPFRSSVSIVDRVINQWENDKNFVNKSGRPRVLTYKGPESEFHTLCSTISTTVNPATVLFELERIKAVEKTARGLKLTKGELRLTHDPESAFQLLNSDVDSLIRSVEENVLDPAPITNLHVRTEYDNISIKALPKIRRWLVNEGKDFHRRARDFLSRFDHDIHPDEKDEAGGRVVLTAFSLSSPAKTPLDRARKK